MERLFRIQQELKCAKNQRNDFGKYNYRSCEDILEAVKPLLNKEKLLLKLEDEMVQVGDKYYVKATATIKDFDGKVIETTQASAREEETKKGMDGSQITGASSSYARKYALNGLFLIDDVKDSDATNDGTENETKPKTLGEATNFKLTFGKYSGEKLGNVIINDPDYANWLYSNGDDNIKACLDVIIKHKKEEKINGE